MQKEGSRMNKLGRNSKISPKNRITNWSATIWNSWKQYFKYAIFTFYHNNGAFSQVHLHDSQDVIMGDKFKMNSHTFTICLQGLYFAVFANMQMYYTRINTQHHGSITKYY